MKESVSNKIKVLNFIFTLVIVLVHFRNIQDYNIKLINDFDAKIYNGYFYAIEYLKIISMTFFFLISGFLFYFNIETVKQTIIKMKNRIKTVLVPYIIWSVIAIIAGLTIDKIMGNKTIMMNSVYSVIMYLFFSPINVPLWYMIALLLLMLPAPIVVRLKNKKQKSIIAYFLILVIWLFYQLSVIPHPIVNKDWWWFENLILYIPAYFFGAFLGLNYSNKIINVKYNIKKSANIGLIIIFTIILSTILVKKYFFNSIFICCIIGICGLWMLLNSKRFEKKPSKFLNSAFYIYAMHQPILIPIVNKIIVVALRNVTITGYQFVLVKLLGMTIIAIISYLVYLLVQRFCPKKIKFIFTGGRD